MRILRRDRIEGNSGTWRLCKGQLGKIHARKAWMTLPIPESNTYLLAVKEEAEVGMVSTISFIQYNLQHSFSAFEVISRRVWVEGIDVALIQEPWYREGCVRGLNIPGHILFFAGGTYRPRTCILTRNETALLLLGFSCRARCLF